MDKLLNKRESNFELLRIISMILIILYHLVFYSDYQLSHLFGFNDFIFTWFMSGGKLGVILFVMVTGYYMINKKDIKLRKLVELELQVLFYSIILLLIFMVFGNKTFTLNELSKLLFPNISRTYWFFSGYFVLYLCIPYLNKLILGISKKEFERLLIIGFVFLILVPSIVIYNKNITSAIYLFYYYIVGSYIKLFGDQIKGCGRYLIMSFISYLLIVGITMYINYLSFSNVILKEYVYSFSRISSILIFVSGISLFLFFKGLRIGKIKIINLLSSLSFGVYLFHEHIFMRDLLWNNVFSIDKLLDGGFVLVKALLVVFIIYLIGGVFDLVRKVIFKYFNNIMEKFGLSKVLN